MVSKAHVIGYIYGTRPGKLWPVHVSWPINTKDHTEQVHGSNELNADSGWLTNLAEINWCVEGASRERLLCPFWKTQC